MKKTFLIQFDYNEGAETPAESFGTTIEELVETMQKEAKAASENSIENVSDVLVYMLENNLISGGVLMAKLAMALTRERQEIIVSMIEKGLLGGEL